MKNNKWKKFISGILAVCLVAALLLSNQSFGVFAEEKQDSAQTTQEDVNDISATDENEQLEEDEKIDVSSQSNTVTMDLYYGDITFTDDAVTYYDDSSVLQNISYDANTKYRITQTDASSKTTNHTIAVGTEKQAVTKAYTIYLAGVNIDAPGKDGKVGHKAAIYVNTDANMVNLVLENGSQNTVVAYSYGYDDGQGNKAEIQFAHAAIEKEINTQGTLRITCEDGLNKEGHDCKKDGSCGVLTATAKSNGKVYWNGAGIGSKGYIGNNHDHSGTESSSGTMYNLVIAGGVITATGSGGSGNGGGPGIGIGQSGPDSQAVGYNAKGLEIDGGYIVARAGNGATTNIGGGFHSGYVELTINGGYIEALRDGKWSIEHDDWFHADVGAAIGGGSGGSSTSAFFGATVTINGGTIKASATYGAAIGSSAGGSNGDGAPATVIINGGIIDAFTTKGYGAAIGTGGSAAAEGSNSSGIGKASDANITITGGTITASSEYGADIGGGGTQSKKETAVGGDATIDITGGTITTTGNGLGGGLALAGQGGNASIRISGGTINTTSIGGGNSTSNKAGDASVYISSGTLDVKGKIGGGDSETGAPGSVTSDTSAGVVVTGGTLKAGTIGGGKNANGKIGFATINISGGNIQGQFILSNTDEGKKCTFTMSGGTIDNTNLGTEDYQMAQKNGGAVYLSDPNGEVSISGGTIQSCKAEQGGAIYMTNGTFELSGTGIIDHCVATGNADGSVEKLGGVLYLGNGTVSVKGGSIKNSSADKGGGAYLANGQLNVSGGTIESNTASEDGGGFYLAGGQIYITDGTMKSNIAQNGAGAYVADSMVRMFGGNITGNQASENGGGMYISSADQAADVVIRSGSLTNNTAGNSKIASDQGNGGAIAVVSSSSNHQDHVVIGVREKHPELDFSTREFNSFTYDDEKDLDSSGESINHEHASCPEITGNSATGNGGGIYMNSSSSVLDIYCLLEKDNTATNDTTGGSIMSEGGKVNIGDIDADGNGNNTENAVGNIFIQSPMLVKGGDVRICGNAENPCFAKEILVDIKKESEGTSGKFTDERLKNISEDKYYVIEYFENFDESGAYKSLQYADGSDIRADGSLYKHAGYKILGWDTNPDATNPTYVSGELIGSENNYDAWKNVGDSGALKLYAIWKKISYTVEYSPGENVTDYTGTMEPQTFEYGVSEDENGNAIALHPNEYQVTGKRFESWKTEDGKEIPDQYAGNDLSLTDGATVKLYAQWRDCTHDPKTEGSGHLFYTLNGRKNTITETCDCGGYNATVTISGADVYYDGEEHPATLQYSKSTLIAGEATIQYSYKQNTQEAGYSAMPDGTTVPTETGYYKAEITVEGVTAFVTYQIKSPADAATIDVTAQMGQHFDNPTGNAVCTVAQDDAFTVRFNVQGLNKGTNEGADKAYQTAPVLTLSKALPSGTTIIMQAEDSYWYNNNPSGNEIELSSFRQMGGKESDTFNYQTDKISDTQDYRFIIDFSHASSYLDEGDTLQVGLKYTYGSSGTNSSMSGEDKEEKATITIASEGSFGVDVLQNVCTVTAPSEIADTRWEQKNLVWKITEKDTSVKLPADAKLTMTTTENGVVRTAMYSLNKNGEFVIPFTWTNNQQYTFALSSQQEAAGNKTYNLTAVLCIGTKVDENKQPTALEDNLQKASQEVSLTVPVSAIPALKISGTTTYGTQRVLSSTDTLHVHIDYKNVDMDEYTIKAIIQKDTGAGYEGNLSEQTITKTGDYAFSMQTTKGSGNYRVWVTVSKNEQTLLEVPYYFIVQ